MNAKKLSKRGQAKRLPFPCYSGNALLGALLLTIALTAAFLVEAAYAQAPGGSYDEAEAQSIDRALMCPVCPAESIDQAQVPLARQMRQRVREMLAQGASRQEILDYFALRYGESVLAAPPKTGFNLLAWTLPIAGIIAALIAGFLVLRAMTGKESRASGSGAAEAVEPSDTELEPYLTALDRSLKMTGRNEATETDNSPDTAADRG